MKLRTGVVGFLLLLPQVGLLAGQTLAIQAAKVYASPGAQPLVHVTVLIRNGKIAAIGRNIAVPRGIEILRCRGCSVCAGFWNTHVHFIEPKWNGAATLPAERLTRELREMLTRSGFTTVVDTGSDPNNTIALRRRIESGEISGPRIYTAGLPLYPPNAIPYYLRDLPAELLLRLPQPTNPSAARAAVETNIGLGTDLVKLFTGSIVSPNHIVPMPIPVARAAVEAAHAHHQLVFTHATNLTGVEVALTAGVDVLAHTPELTKGIDEALLNRLVRNHLTIIPTLMLFSKDSDIGEIRNVVKRFHDLGGQLMFGTDTGFLTDYNVEPEYQQLYESGLSFRQVLAMLTTIPAQRFGVDRDKGRIRVGMDGDLTILANDPADADPAAMTKVQYTIRHGMVIFDAASVASSE